MATTPLGFPYPALTDAPNGPSQIQAAVTAIDTYLTPSTLYVRGSNALAVTANTNIAFTVNDDPLSAWNATTHLWTCPVAGHYLINAQTRAGGTAAQVTCGLAINGSVSVVNSAASSTAGANGGLSVVLALVAGATIAVQSGVAYTMSATGQIDNWLSLARIGP